MGRVRSPKRRVRDDNFMLGLSSDYRRIWSECVRIVFLLAEAIQGFSVEMLTWEFPGRRSIWWGWRVTLLAPRIGMTLLMWRRSLLTFILCGRRSLWSSWSVSFVAGAAFGAILGDSRSAKCCIFQYKIVSKIAGGRSPKRRVRDDDFIFGLSSDYPRIMLESSFYWRKHFREFPLKSWASRFSGRRSTWWVSKVTLFAPRIGNDVSYVTRINDEIHFAWQAQYLVKLECDFSWQRQHLVQLGDSRSAKCCIFRYKIVSKIAGGRSPKRRVRDDDFIFGLSSDYPRIMLESSFCWRKHFREFPLKSWASRFSGRRSIWWSWRVTLLAPRIGNDVSYVTQINDEIHRRSIWWSWRVTLLAPRIGNDVSYVTRINDEIHFAWQAQYLVKLEGDFTCSAHWKWRFICDADQWCDSMCGAGAVFWWSWRVTLLAPRIGNDVSYVMRINDAIQCAGQAQ